ncbi:DUF680 domain-containing protein [Mesorhizobium sp. B2-8-5]|uniref:DUF680 domain-containing protein n=1 Tax=Mesorhizobium sp. B3-1-7 TaxID=2589894 RepID=UPI00299F8DED|nr:DUF680 domain-containing protein [Mesorhizobium sp. B2-8-5]
MAVARPSSQGTHQPTRKDYAYEQNRLHRSRHPRCHRQRLCRQRPLPRTNGGQQAASVDSTTTASIAKPDMKPAARIAAEEPGQGTWGR